ncbi:hypothetical protein LRS03_23315 [Rhizobacter sp. J219]|uniref:hypothetical protein n=1 Tax=Rhizobacter sp. J219 TaxID=2898430 RepID=UPI002151827A|nr:hypothetical protein [Rhizobacter sp. J219]MCR5885627.1 hypothetical protein [Rhizobacter sp. J219]
MPFQVTEKVKLDHHMVAAGAHTLADRRKRQRGVQVARGRRGLLAGLRAGLLGGGRRCVVIGCEPLCRVVAVDHQALAQHLERRRVAGLVLVDAQLLGEPLLVELGGALERIGTRHVGVDLLVPLRLRRHHDEGVALQVYRHPGLPDRQAEECLLEDDGGHVELRLLLAVAQLHAERTRLGLGRFAEVGQLGRAHAQERAVAQQVLVRGEQRAARGADEHLFDMLHVAHGAVGVAGDQRFRGVVELLCHGTSTEPAGTSACTA